MSANDSVKTLRACDPARTLEPLPVGTREVLRDRITATAWATPTHPRRRHAPMTVRVCAAAVAALVLGVGAAWAAGAITPLSIFEDNPQQRAAAVGGVWDQRVIPSSVVEAARIVIPAVGTIGFWSADSRQGGWCGALRLPGGAWIGTGRDPLDAGGSAPGCYPTREAVNNASGTPVYVINGFDYAEGMVDARPAGGSFWRIDYGKVDLPGAVRVEDTVSGRGAKVVPGGLFALAIPDAHPESTNDLQLVAYDASGRPIGSA